MRKTSGGARLVLGLVAAIFVGSILWSIWFETLAPLLEAGDLMRFWLNIVGIPIILIGTGAIVWGGGLIVRNTLTPQMEDPAFLKKLREKGWPAQAEFYRRAWGAGFGLMVLGFGLLAVGGYIINR